MKEKLTSLADAVRRIPSGSTIAMGGNLLRRQPNAFIREIIRQGIGDLTLYTFASSTPVDMLAAAGALKRVEGIYFGFFGLGMAPNFRRAAEQGRIDVRDFPESGMVVRLRAAGAGLSFHPLKTTLGTDMARLNPDQVREIVCPFTGETYHALPAARADFTIMHGYVGDKYGNIQIPVVRDSDDIDQLMAKAGRKVIASVERIVPHEQIRANPTLTLIPHVWVDAIVEAPYGAHPCACDGFYDEDVEHLEMYLEAARDEQAFDTYLDRYVREPASHEAYLECVGGLKRLEKLCVGEVV
ncbi:MAG: CoA transferase subunit A [Rhodospirillales bacterium]|nr:CoA transferase subunit A [Rhodospirillales bacterium]